MTLKRKRRVRRTRAPKYVFVLRAGQFIKIRLRRVHAFFLEESK